MSKCAVCQSDDTYDWQLNSHTDRYALTLEPSRGRIELRDMEQTPEVFLTDVAVRYCPLCGRELGIERANEHD